MMFLITVIGFLFLTATGLLGDNPWIPKNCTKPGEMCENPNTLVACIEENGTFTKRFLTNCSEDHQICLDGNCTFDPGRLCDLNKVPIICSDVGIFPHPFYCNKFVECVNDSVTLTPYVKDCPEGFQFDVDTDLCDIPWEDGECDENAYPDPVCKYVGQAGILAYGRYFYVCQYVQHGMKICPYLYVCPHGEIVDENYDCVDNASLEEIFN